MEEDLEVKVNSLTSQLHKKETEVRNLYERVESGNQGDMVSMLRKEIDAQKTENRMLRDKVGHLTHQLDMDRGSTRVEEEVDRLRKSMAEKERES